MSTYCAHLVADLFLFCYVRDYMMSLSDEKQTDIIDAFNTTSRYLDDILNFYNVYFDNTVNPEILVMILFSRIALKDIFATLNIRD